MEIIKNASRSVKRSDGGAEPGAGSQGPGKDRRGEGEKGRKGEGEKERGDTGGTDVSPSMSAKRENGWV
jgi:hypothetical protein